MRDNLSFYESPSRSEPVSIVGVPVEIGSDERGFHEAPKALLAAGMEQMLASLGREVHSIEHIQSRKPRRVETAGTAKYAEEIAAVAHASSEAVQKSISAGNTVIALGGDHSMAIGTISGVAEALRKEGRVLGVIWIDAHPDCNTPDTTISGNVHGQVASALAGFGHPLLTSVGSVGRKISPEHVVYIGLKDIDPLEIEYLRREKSSCITMLDIAERGLSRATLAIDALRRKVDEIWISMDMDSIDAEYAPGVGMPNQGGLTRREVLSLAQYIGKRAMPIGCDIVEVVPRKDVEGKTVKLAIEIAARFLGGEYGWYQNEYMDAYAKTNVAARKY